MMFIDNVSFSPGLAASQKPILKTDTSPATAADVIGGEVTFFAVFSSGLPTTYQWQKVVNGQATDITGATTPSLTLSNLQLSDTGSYWLQATNTSGVSVSTVSPLTVSSLPAAVGNVITAYAAQTGLGSALQNFSPTWDVVPGSLISAKSPASVGTGNFNQNISVLTDGSPGRSTFGYLAATATQVTSGNGAGQSVTYSLGSSPGGYDLSNIVVYGGWSDAGRDQQSYTVYYSTVSAPTTFIQLAVVDYNPANPKAVQSATRASLSAATNGLLATSVAALKFDFTSPAPENGYCGYTEIAVYGAPLEPVITMQTGNTTFLPSWKLTTDNSLMTPSSSAGNFNLNSNGKAISALTTPRILAISPTTGGDNTFNYMSCGNGNGAGSSVVYTLPASASGQTLTKIVVHGGWSDAGRDQQAYTVSYSKVATPTTFVSLGAVNSSRECCLLQLADLTLQEPHQI